MPTFELSDATGTYEIEAPNERAALSAFQQQSGRQAAPQVGISGNIAGIGKSLGVGLADSAIGMAGLPGDIGSAVGLGVDYAGSKFGFDPSQVQQFKEAAKTAASVTPARIFSGPGSEYIKSRIEGRTGPFYRPQGAVEELVHKAGEFLPSMIGGPATVATKLATRVALPAVASEIGKNVAGVPGEIAGSLLGVGGGIAAELKNLNAVARKAASPQSNTPAADAIIKRGKDQFKSAEDMNLVVAPEFATDAAAKMRADLRGFDPEAQSYVFKAADRLAGLAPAPSSARPAASQATAAVAPVGVKVDGAPPSLLEFIASKGGLKPDAELEAIGLASGHRAQIPGQRGFYSVVSKRGESIDRVREAAEEAGYLRGQNGATSTPRDLLDAIDAELRGKKQYPIGHEGSRTKREGLLMSEREQATYESHMRQFDDAINEAGYNKISPDLRSRAVHLMEREGMNADTAIENALLQLEQEDALGRATRAINPPPLPGDFVHGFPPDMAKGVAMNDVELIRKQLVSLKTSPDASVREAARRAISSLQESQTSLNPTQVINGNAGEYTKTMREAIANYAAGKRSNTVMGKVALGELNAATAGSGANEDNALRQAIKQLARPVNNDIVPKWKRLGFSDAEGAAIERVARGSAVGNTARFLGKFAPTGVVSGAGALGLGSLAGGPVGAVALPAAGYLAKRIGDMSTKKAVATLDLLVRSRSPLAQQVAAQVPPYLVQRLPAKTKLMLGAVSAGQIPQAVPANR